MSETRSFQILDRACSVRKEVCVSSLSQLVRDGEYTNSAPFLSIKLIYGPQNSFLVQEKFEFTDDLKIVLECDGTIVDDEEYFATLEPNTSLMVLKSDESWNAPASRCNTYVTM